MADAGRFGRLATAMVTPFGESGELDLQAASDLARYLESNGSEALVVGGTTGESPVLSENEKLELFEAVSKAVSVPVLAGSTTSDTAHSVALTKKAASSGVAGILAVTPYYSRPSQEGLYQHFSAVAEATSLPVVLYDIPVRTGRKIASETILRLAREHRNVVGLKDASGDPAGTARLIAKAPAGFEVLSGDDALTLSLCAVGAVGVVSVAAHWVGPELAEMLAMFFAGDVAGAAELNSDLCEIVSFQSSEEFPNPLPAKAVLRAAGLSVGHCRLPLGGAPRLLDERAESLVEELETWRSKRADRGSGA